MASKQEQILDYLVCALSADNHFCKEPITLPGCSHSVCKSCLIKEDKAEIKCARCGSMTNRDLRNDKESFQTKTLIAFSLDDLYKVIEQRTSELLQKIKDAIVGKNERVDVLVKYVEEEIEIRIESLKIQLDEIGEKIKNDLKIIKEDLLESEIRIDPFESKLNELRDDIKKQNTQNEAAFYDYQDYCIKLNEKLIRLERNFYQLEFHPSTELINEKSLIGEINYVNKLNDAKPIDSHDCRLFSLYDYNRTSATIRFTLNELSKFKETNASPKFSAYFFIRNIKWCIEIENKQIENETVKMLGFFIKCKSDKHLKKKSTINAKREFRLMHQSDAAKNYIKVLPGREFTVNGEAWGLAKFIGYEELMKPENGYYNAINDSITVEVLISTESDVIEYEN